MLYVKCSRFEIEVYVAVRGIVNRYSWCALSLNARISMSYSTAECKSQAEDNVPQGEQKGRVEQYGKVARRAPKNVWVWICGEDPEVIQERPNEWRFHQTQTEQGYDIDLRTNSW